MPTLPSQYRGIWKKYTGLMKSLESLGKAAKEAGPLSLKHSHLVQLAAAAAIQSEGSVHSHTRRAREAGATPEEIRHAVVLLVEPTVYLPEGFLERFFGQWQNQEQRLGPLPLAGVRGWTREARGLEPAGRRP
jgi:AhpD family alkylhydroperoxidase